ncbi:MAG: TfoX/Sxy family protein [Anaerolineaceae bacterium]|nr:TfoX/Sxy family protein [Anaerolineaceae bacterium]
MAELEKLPNIGKTLAEKLHSIGVNSYDELAALGSVQAVLHMRTSGLDACINTLYAMEGAIRGVRWHFVPDAERQVLKDELEGFGVEL